MLLRRNRRGLNVVELIAIVFVVIMASIALVYGLLFLGGVWLWSQSVGNVDAIRFLEREGYADVQLVDSYRTDEEDDLGCSTASTAGFVLRGKRDALTDEVAICCVGEWGDEPHCNVLTVTHVGTE